MQSYNSLVAKEFNAYLSELISARQTNVQKISQQTGMSRTTIDRHISGETEPTIQIREKYAKAFNFETVQDFDRGWVSEEIDVSALRSIAEREKTTAQAILDEALRLWRDAHGKSSSVRLAAKPK